MTLPAKQKAIKTSEGSTVTKQMTGPILGAESTRPTVNVPVASAATSSSTVNTDPSSGLPKTTFNQPANGTLAGPYIVQDPNGGSHSQAGMNVVDNKMVPNAYTPAPVNDGLAELTASATKSVNDKIAAQIAAYNQQVQSGQQANNLALNQNNNYLAQQLKESGESHTLANSGATQLQNRRGGFYSGGLDYQLGSQDRAYATQEGNLRQDVQTRNDDIYAKNALLASQAASNIQMLQSQAPDMIRAAIQEELDRQRGIAIQEAGITGQYQGKNTMTQNQNIIQNNIAESGLTGNYTPPAVAALQQEMNQNSAAYAGASPADQIQLHERNLEIAKQLGMTFNSQTGSYSGGSGPIRTVSGQNADREAAKQLADLTGYMPDGHGGYMPTNAKQQQELTNAWKVAEEMGVVSPALSALTGIKAGTPTQKAKDQAIQNSISQQNADTSTANGIASRANMKADNDRADNALKLNEKQKTFAGTVVGDLEQADSEQDVIDYFKTNAAHIAENLGPDAVAKLKKEALAPYQKPAPVVKTDPEVVRKREIRDKAIAAAQKESQGYTWTNATPAEREKMIKSYEDLYN